MTEQGDLAATSGRVHRERRRRGSRARIALLVLVCLSALVGIGIWLGSSWLSTYRKVEAAKADLSDVRGALAARDWSQVALLLPGAKKSTVDLAASTEDAPWRLLEQAPIVGSTASAIHDVATSSSEILSAAEPLVPYADKLVSGKVRAENGKVDLSIVEEIAPLLKRLSISLESAGNRLNGIDTSAVRPEAVAPIEDLSKAIADASPGVAMAAQISRWIPGMLGSGAPREWLILLQNPAEARGTGGFVGGYATVTADNGEVLLKSVGTSADLGTTPIPSDGVAKDAQVLWGNILEAWNTYNTSPNYPLAGELSAAGMAVRGTPISGVIAIDPTVVAALLKVTGPITAAGKTITSDDVERFFTVEIYRDYPEPEVRDQLTMELTKATVSAFLSVPWEPGALAEAVKGPASEGRIQVWSSDPNEQEWLADGPVGGLLPSSPGSVVGVAFNNASGNKMDAFVQTQVDYAPGRCPTSSEQRSSLEVRLMNEAPTGLPTFGGSYARLDDPDAPEGSTNMLVHIYAPVDAEFVSSTIDGKDAPLYLGFESNRPVWWTYAPMERGQERVINVQFKEPTVLGVKPRVIPQAMVKNEVITVSPQAAC